MIQTEVVPILNHFLKNENSMETDGDLVRRGAFTEIEIELYVNQCDGSQLYKITHPPTQPISI